EIALEFRSPDRPRSSRAIAGIRESSLGRQALLVRWRGGSREASRPPAIELEPGTRSRRATASEPGDEPRATRRTDAHSLRLHRSADGRVASAGIAMTRWSVVGRGRPLPQSRE